ncbi:GDP-mannose 4,6 dehydratase [Treponema sp. R8-4-B8]
MKALIIGAAGFVGRHLIIHLKSLGWEVSATRLPQEEIKEDVPNYELDILNQASISSLLDKIRPDYLFHLAAQSSVALSWEKPALTADINIKGAVNLLEALRVMQNPPRVLLIGSGEEYGYILPEELPIKENTLMRPGNIYACTKVAQDLLGHVYAHAYKLEIIMVRAFNHTGPGQIDTFATANFCKQIAEIEAGLHPPIIYVGNLSSMRDFTDVRDIVKAYALLIQKGRAGEAYNVGSGKAIAMQEVLEIALSLAKTQITVKQNPALMRVSDTPVIQADISRLTHVTSWKPDIPLRDTITDMLDDWRKKIVSNKI